MLRAVIFDFDGVITDSEVLHLRAFNAVLGQYGVEISKEQYYKDYLGLTDLECFGELVSRGQLKLDEQELQELMQQKNEVFEQLVKDDGGIMEGVVGFLKTLQESGITMGICSGALLGEIELILEKAGISSYFEVIVSAEQIKKGKPDPEGFELTLEKLNKGRENPIATDECVVIEDSHWGLEGAKAAGMHTVAITNSYDAEQLGMSERIIGELSELRMSDLQELCG